MFYTKEDLSGDLEKLKREKYYITTEICGHTSQNSEIPLIIAGNPQNKSRALIISGHHALETITSKFILEYLINSAGEDFSKTALFVIPLLNIDGADFAAGKRTNPNFQQYRRKWQANFRGIDLNHNYAAGFYKAKQAVKKEGINSPHFTKYGGKYPFSESETKAVKKLCGKYRFDAAIAFHTQGEEIYCGYNGVYPKNTRELLEKFSGVSGYIPSLPTGTASHAGFKDWFIKKYKKPAFTIEAGLGKNPLPACQYEEIYRKCKPIVDILIHNAL
jgi:g-D-glutamyl-meso-diaminopimelate peptidase